MTTYDDIEEDVTTESIASNSFTEILSYVFVTIVITIFIFLIVFG